MTLIMQDPAVIEFVSDGSAWSRADVVRWIARSGRRLRETGFGTRTVTLRADGTLIGRVAASKSPRAEGAELTVGIAAPYRGRGYGAEAVSGLIAASPVHPIFAWVESANPASLRLLLGCGFQVIGRSSEADGSAKIRLGLNHEGVTDAA